MRRSETDFRPAVHNLLRRLTANDGEPLQLPHSKRLLSAAGRVQPNQIENHNLPTKEEVMGYGRLITKPGQLSEHALLSNELVTIKKSEQRLKEGQLTPELGEFRRKHRGRVRLYRKMMAVVRKAS